MLYRPLICLSTALALSACAAKSGFEPYQAQANFKKTEAMTYQLNSVQLTLGGDKATDRYPSEAILQDNFKKSLEQQLSKRSLAGSGYMLDVVVKWDRHMSGFKSGDVFSSAGCWFESKISKNGTMIANDYGDPLNANSVMYEQRNLFNNLKRIGQTLSQTGSPDSEQGELNRCVALLAKRLPH